ncbi:tryptophan synthase subunit alpha [Dictyobacter arantiisoli]|uniref:Tryptophan synthase alpha chain n=1 Tax=Dictyobacter arantiisoli TaxID=2014874 RepID=A0A5A5TAN4_9CHLR|nr:tryptophan synthase subunit alpha [Dictyobacter arantiisoli]GCF08049.1 tryptophan synthase alpha chain [Dictyobacter arantiisoli]
METISSGVITPENQQYPVGKITQTFERAHSEQRGVIIPYFMCGYPNIKDTVDIVLAAAEGGADIIELGMPFSDPLADGATIQHAGQVALEQGMTIQGCMDIAKQVSAKSDVTLLMMGYYNPILSYGLERFCATASANGVSGLIIPDLPVEEADPLQEIAYRHGLALIYLVPPTAPDERIVTAAKRTATGPGGFIYCVALSGVTGSRLELPAHLQDFIARIRAATQEQKLPLAVGFGLSTPAHIATVTSYAEGAVIGSALVKLIDQHKDDQPAEAVKMYIQSLRQK